MNPADELALLKRHVRRIEADLSHANRQIADLERRLGKEPSPPADAFATAGEGLLPPPLPAAALKTAATTPAPAPIQPPPPLPRQTQAFAPAALTTPDSPSPLRVWLTSLQLWPPAGEPDAEIRLGAWWATRIGAVLAVIGVVLFGVYVSVNTPPWVKFVELLAISVSVAGAGLWWSRRVPRFGAVVFAAGLALLYFCAFAGYALPAVKVIDGIAAASLWQLAAVGLLVAAAVARRSSGIATMAVGFGYVTAIFSRFGELHTFALATSLLLGFAAVGMHRLLRWEAPSVVAMPGCHAVYALVVLGSPGRVAGSDAWWVWGVLLATVLLFFARDWRLRSPVGPGSWGERWFQAVNAGLALLVGAAVALSLFRAQLAWFYLGSAGMLAVLATLRRRQAADDPVGIVLLTMAAGALALAIMEAASGHTTALALLAQAWVLLRTAGALRSKTLSGAAGVVAVAAYAYFVAGFEGAVPVASPQAAGMVLFVAGFAWLAAEATRRMVADLERWAVSTLGGLAAFTAAWLSIQSWQPDSWLASWTVVMAIALVAVGVAARAKGAFLAAGFLAIAGHLLVWHRALFTAGSPDVSGNAFVVAGVSIAVGFGLGSAWAERVTGRWGQGGPVAATLLWALSVVTMAVVIFEVCTSPLMAFIGVYGLAVLLAGLSPLLGKRHLPWLAVEAVAVGLVLWAGQGAVTESRGALVLALGLGWALPFVLAAVPRYRACVRAEGQGALIEPLLVAAATVVTYRLLPWTVEPAWRIPLFALAALAVGLAGQRWRLSAAIPASWMIWLMVGIGTLENLTTPMNSMQRSFAAFAAVLVWVPAIRFATAARNERESSWTAEYAAVIQVTLAAVLGLWLAVVGWRDAGQLLALLGVVSLAWLVQRSVPLPSARMAAVLLLGLTWVRAGLLAFLGEAEGPGLGFAAVLAVGVITASVPWLFGRLDPGEKGREAPNDAWLAGGAALGLVFLLALVQRGVMAPYTTVGWGTAAILLFVAGLFVRLRPYRLLGLAGLLVCIPRVFLVDLQSAFHRIIAFVVLGAVLLWVGFSYHRFRHLIVDTKEKS